MAINLSALSPLTTAATALSNLILVSPQDVKGYEPQNPPDAAGNPSTAQRPPSLLFHYEGEQQVVIESDITDHYVENNSAIQDQIALKPEIVTTDGFIGELNDVTPYGLQTIKTAADKLTTVEAYAPGISETATLAYNEAFFLYQNLATIGNSAISAWDSLNSIGGESVINGQGIVQQDNQNRQQTAFQQFYAYWRKRTLFTVQTPWAVFQNMAILKLQAIQSEETNVITDFKVTFKMIRNAASLTSPLGFDVSFSGRAASQNASATDLGSSSPTPSIGISDGLAGVA